MRRLFLIVFMLICLGQMASAQQRDKVDEDLLQRMALMEDGESVEINIILRAQYEPAEMRRKSSVFGSAEARKSFVVEELKDFSQSSQQGLLLDMGAFTRSSKISRVKSHWIVNAINCFATAEAIEELSLHPAVLAIGFDKKYQLIWENEKRATAEPVRGIAPNITKIGADVVWNMGYTGQGIVVAVLDSGVNYDHTDLVDCMWEHPDFPYHGYNFADDNNDPKDDEGHGTHCAGTVAGTGVSGTRTGVAPSAKIMAVRIMNSDGEGQLSHSLAGIEFAIENGAHVLSMSFGYSGGGANTTRIALREAMVNTLEAGVVAAVAAGNDGSGFGPLLYPVPRNVGLPGNCPPPWLHPDQTIEGGLSAVISIGATDENDRKAKFSSIGPATWQAVEGFADYAYNPGIGLIRPDICAPGVDIVSLSHSNNSGYREDSGTSMATPCMAGVIALMLSKQPDLTPADICRILETTAVPLSETKSNYTGSGRVDAVAAMEALSLVPLVVKDQAIAETAGNENGRWNPGETVTLSVTLENKADSTLKNVTAELTSSNEFVTINKKNASFGDFKANETKAFDNAFEVTLSKDAPGNQEIVLMLNITTSGVSDALLLKTMIYDYVLRIVGIENHEQPNEPEETREEEAAGFSIYLINEGNEDASELWGALATNSPTVTVESEAYYGTLYQGQYKPRRFDVVMSTDAKPRYEIPMTMTVSDKNGKTTELAFVWKEESDFPASCGNLLEYDARIEGTEVTLQWQTSDSDTAPTMFVLYRDNEFLTTTAETSYTETMADVAHTYCVEALYEAGCTSRESCIYASTVGIADRHSNVRLYPNPANGFLIVEGANLASVNVYNTLGQAVERLRVEDNSVSINTSNYVPNLYILETISKEGVKSCRKFIVKH